MIYESQTDSGLTGHLRVGTVLGKYILELHLGSGGACEVWRAKDRIEGIRVALKIPLIGGSGKRDNDSLLREVRAVAKLRHPHILTVKNADIIDGQAVLATELCTRTLEDCTRPMAVGRIIQIVDQVLSGLAHAHQQRIVHCDVTPGNIFLLPDRRAVLGDFGIAIRVRGRAKTIDDFGTPGYVAPEQAYGYPTYRSDCFAVGVILYEYIAGVLPRWPFEWPPRGYDRLKQRTSLSFAAFVKQALAVNLKKRFANADKMHQAMLAALPKRLRNGHDKKPVVNWQKQRRQAFVKRYSRVLGPMFACQHCGEPMAESMAFCPWCGHDRQRWRERTRFSMVCPRCHHGLMPQWESCPWCREGPFETVTRPTKAPLRYGESCEHCGGRMMRFMTYCLWCRRKVQSPWQAPVFPETCGKCEWPVDSTYWRYCPWCGRRLYE